MPIVIEIDPENSLTPAHSPGAGQLETEVTFKPSETALSGNDLTLAVDFEFRVVLPTEASEQQTLLSISCTFAAEYDLRPGFSPDREQMEAFHKGNVVLNCWPYFASLSNRRRLEWITHRLLSRSFVYTSLDLWNRCRRNMRQAHLLRHGPTQVENDRHEWILIPEPPLGCKRVVRNVRGAHKGPTSLPSQLRLRPA